jgi:hypothetical protein
MDREEIIRMALEACDQAPREDWNSTAWVFGDETLERFAALVAAAERSACAKVCEDIPLPKDSKALTHGPTIERCAAAIRARGNT